MIHTWLVLVHQIPPTPPYLRAKIVRRLARVGAVAVKNAVYVLPTSETALEHFQWMRTEIVAGGGEATILSAQFVDGLTDGDVIAMFRAARDADYAELAADARALDKRRVPDDRDVAKLEARLAELAAIDFFSAPTGDEAAQLVRALRARLDPTPRRTDMLDRAQLKDRVWVTRTGVKVDRIASAWLVRRFIDKDAGFKFVAERDYAPGPREIRFDMPNGELTHEADRCTFEVIVARAGLAAPGLAEIAEIVHDIDLHDDRYARPETQGIAALLAGMIATVADDDARIAQGMAMFDSLLAHLAHKRAPA